VLETSRQGPCTTRRDTSTDAAAGSEHEVMRIMHETFNAKKGCGGCDFWQLKAHQAKLPCNLITLTQTAVPSKTPTSLITMRFYLSLRSRIDLVTTGVIVEVDYAPC
jgi:hypothetical protein